jgi:hypothetical protein
MVDIVGSHHCPDKLLEEVVFFIGALGRRDARKLVSLEMIQGAGHILDGLIPSDLNKLSCPLDKGRCHGLGFWFSLVYPVRLPFKRVVCPDMGRRKPVGAVNESITKTAADTKLATVYRIVGIPSGASDGVATHTQIETAAHTAVSARGLRFPGGIFNFLRYECGRRTTLNAFPTRDTDGLLEGLITKGADLEFITPIGHVNGINPHDFPAGSDTDAAMDALVRIEIKERIAGVQRKVLGHTVQAIESFLVEADAVNQ